MRDIDIGTGQKVDHREHRDNLPPRYSAPGTKFNQCLTHYANAECASCGGTGYRGVYKHVAAGRCFDCLPDKFWNDLIGEYHATGTSDVDGAPLCEIRYMNNRVWEHAGFRVAEIGLPSVAPFEVFETFEEACESATARYGV